MKKLFIAALALTAFTACSQDELVEQQQLSNAIAFDGAFVENATRAAVDPSTTTASITAFDVWGFMDEAGGDVFNQERVTKSNGTWSYQNLQYWLPNHTYYFAALSPVDNQYVTVTEATTTEKLQKGLGTVAFTNYDGTIDLIYAAETATTNDNNYLSMPKVALTFNHLLSKVKFTFKNGFVNDNNTMTIKTIKMVAPGGASIDLATDDWWTSPDKWIKSSSKTTLNFGDVNGGEKINAGASSDCANERLTIPANAEQKYTVTFDVVLYSGTVEAYTRQITTTVEGVALEMGKAYNFVTTLDATNIAEDALKPIEFEVTEVKEWVIVENKDLTSTLTNASVAANETLTLVSNTVVDGSLNVAGTLNGAGHTLSPIKNPNSNNGLVRPSGTDVVVKNVTIDGKGYTATVNGASKNIRGIYIQAGGKYTLDNVDIVGAGYALNVSTTANVELNVTNSTFEGWTSYGGTTVATFHNSKFTKGSYNYVDQGISNGYFRPYGTTTLSNCTFENGYTIDFASLAENATVTFNNCYYGENLITAEYVAANPTVFTGYAAAKCIFLPNLKNVTVAAGETTTLTSNAVIEGTLAVSGTLDGAGHTISSQVNPTDNGLVRPSGSATIQNVTIDGKGYKSGTNNLRAIYITTSGTYNLTNVVTTGTGYALNAQGSNITLNISKSTLEGWLSYGAGTTATFTEVNFTKGSYSYVEGNQFTNGYFRPYGTTTLTNCKFESEYTIDFAKLTANNKSITFDNCYVGTTKITASNISTLLNVESYDASVVTFK
ncbi:MAG: fimbrillin family protein [Bacteroidaceae bacterium]|nr:fimbrillin family protein [Bacteroidaceae bacterium]